MHELSLCRSIYGIVDTARTGRGVETVYVKVGHLRQVVPETLEHCWEIVTHDTPLQGSRLEIDHVPIELRCRECCATTTAPGRLMLVCAACGSGQVDVAAGEEFIVTTMDVKAEESEQVHG